MWKASFTCCCCSSSDTTRPSTASVLTPCVSCVPSRQAGPHQETTWWCVRDERRVRRVAAHPCPACVALCTACRLHTHWHGLLQRQPRPCTAQQPLPHQHADVAGSHLCDVLPDHVPAAAAVGASERVEGRVQAAGGVEARACACVQTHRGRCAASSIKGGTPAPAGGGAVRRQLRGQQQARASARHAPCA
jgi:hypothetical protein